MCAVSLDATAEGGGSLALPAGHICWGRARGLKTMHVELDGDALACKVGLCEAVYHILMFVRPLCGFEFRVMKSFPLASAGWRGGAEGGAAKFVECRVRARRRGLNVLEPQSPQGIRVSRLSC